MTSWIKFYNDELDKGYTPMQALKRVRNKYRRQIDDLTSKIKKVDVKKDDDEENLDDPLNYEDELQIQLEISRCHLHFINRRIEKEREMEKNKKT